MSQSGASRNKKFLKSEKAKTKLKSKRDLPKCTNVTKTIFKVTQLIIPKQLKKHCETIPLSARKLSFKDVMLRLNHFNTNTRTGALESLKELISYYPAVLEENLGQIIHAVTPLILNVEKVVRRETLKVLVLILKNVEVVKLDPFFGVMSTYLRSAMTHIDNRIQEDSLNFLDILLICTPAKISENFHKIAPNFLDMISKLRVDANAGRELTVNLNSQITSAKWRIKVIHRLQDFLYKYVELNQFGNENCPDEIEAKTFDPLKLNYYPVFSTHNIMVCNILNVSNDTQSCLNADDGQQFQNYVDTLMPLLFASWLEVRPKTNADDSTETVISEDAAILLRHILQVISLLHKLAKHFDALNPSSNIESSFRETYKGLLSQHFLILFPYETNIRSKQNERHNVSSSESDIVDPKLITENLEICHLFISFNPNIKVNKQVREINSVLSYIEKTFNHTQNEGICDYILQILQTLFCNKVTRWTKTFTILIRLFKKMIESYFSEDISDSFKQKIFALLCQIALNENLSHYPSSGIYAMWFQSFPDILLGESVTAQTVDIIHKFARTSNDLFNSVMEPKLYQVIENLPKIVVLDCIAGVDSYHRLFSLIYWIKRWNRQSLNLFQYQLINNAYKNDYDKYVFDIFRLRPNYYLS